MDKNKKKIFIFTGGFPYGKGEKSFIIPEINELKNHFDVTIVSRVNKEIFNDKDNITKLDKNVNCIAINEDRNVFLIFILGFKLLFSNIYIEEAKKIFLLKKHVISRLIYSTKYLLIANYYKHLLIENNVLSYENDESIFYSFWNNYIALSLCLYKREHKNITIVSRIHGYDLFNDRIDCQLQVFKEFMNKYINKIIFISNQGMKYYLKHFSKNLSLDKLHTIRLGVSSPKVFPKKEKKHIFTILSCSSIIPLKRVDLIAKSLANIPENLRIKWIHFGDGICYENVKDLISNIVSDHNNISVDLKGYLPCDKIEKYYEKHYIDCFINVSSTEGLPVSIMEAIRFGIPIIATNVGAIKEIVFDNGIVLPKHLKSQNIAQSILKIKSSSKKEILKMRNSSKIIYREYYNCDLNAKKICKLFMTL